jgi:hypothetical protein
VIVAALLFAVLLHDTDWVRLTTPRFDIISSVGERRTRELARDLETLAAALADIKPASARPPATTRVFVFSRRADAQAYFDLLSNREKSEMTGLFLAQNERGAMLIDESRGAMRDRTPYHELVHYLIGTAVPRPPLWLEEGVAEYYSNAEVRGGIIHVGNRIREHMQLLQHRKPIPLDVLFAATRESELGTSAMFYAESWAIVDWMIQRDRTAFDAFTSDLSSGMPPADALRKHFRKSIGDLQHLISSSASSSLPDLPTTLQVRVPEIAGDVKPMTRADVLFEFGRFLDGFSTTRAQAAEHYRAALAANPNHARALAALGEFDRAIAADPSDGEVVLEFAESLLKSELGSAAEAQEANPADAPRLRRARELAQKALALGADRVRALGAIGSSYTIESDQAPGIVALETAFTLAPNRYDLALHLLAFYPRNGDDAKAQSLYARLLAHHENAVNLTARAIVIRTDVARINMLVKDKKLDEASALLRKMSANTPDESLRRQMDDQARALEVNAAANRDVIAYNIAVELYNNRDLPGAQKVVDDLLKTATDPTVIADATRLRELLGQRLKHRR